MAHKLEIDKVRIALFDGLMWIFVLGPLVVFLLAQEQLLKLVAVLTKPKQTPNPW
jgi:hypothetical protein